MLDAAAPGDRIELAPDTYHGDLVIRKPVTLVGNGALVHGTGTGTVLTIRADEVVVEDLSIAHSAPGPVGSPAGIEIRGDDVIVRDVQVGDSYLGIAVYRSTDVSLERVRLEGRTSDGLGDVEHHVASNTSGGSYGRADMAEGRGDGIALVNSEKGLVSDSIVTGARDGIYLSFAKDVLLDGNRVDSGRYGVHSMYAEHLTLSSSTLENNVAGAVLMYGSDALVLGNHLSFNSSASTGFGLLAKDVTEIEVAKNVITHNRVGLHIEGPAGADLHEQRYVLNTVGLNAIGVALVPSAAATLSGNSFVENHLQVVPVGGQAAASVRWDEHGAGNYWSDYRGFDRGGDGVGDVAHRQLGVNSRTLEDNPALFALVGSPALNLTGPRSSAGPRTLEASWTSSR
jgi:nitrous oxidase accessory protein